MIRIGRSDGIYLTQWGTAGTGDGQFLWPITVAVDGSDNVYVVDRSLSRVQVFTSSGTYLTRWGSLGSGNGQFNAPQGVAVDSADNVYVTDSGNTRVQVFGRLPVFATSTTWGLIKALYR